MLITSDTPTHGSVIPYESRIHTSITMFCRELWQYAPREARRAFPQFAQTRPAYEAELKWFIENIASVGISFEELLNFLDALVGLKRFMPISPTPPSSSQLLRLASFARCLLGGGASHGDIATYLRNIEVQYRLPRGSKIELLKEYKRGSRTPLVLFLNELLGQTGPLIAKYHRRLPSDERTLAWCVETETQVSIRHPMINTYYYLLSSLTACIEPERGEYLH